MEKARRLTGEWLILAVVALAFLMRLWPPDYIFYGGHGQEISLAAYEFIHEGRIPLYGYRNLEFYGHYGPMPLYLFSLFALLSAAPFSVVLFTILLSTATTYVVYRTGKDFWNRRVGFIAALLFATSHFSAVTSRFAYTVNFAPLFISLFFYTLLAIIHEKKPAYYGLLFLSAGIILQIHVSAWPVLLLIVPALFFGMPRSRKWLLAGCCILVVLFLPYLYYEASQGFAETKLLQGTLGALGSGGIENPSVGFSEYLGSFFAIRARPLEGGSSVNPFLQNIASIRYFCDNPAQHSRFAGIAASALRMSSGAVWLLFLPLLLLCCVSLVPLVRKRRDIGSTEARGLILLLLLFFGSLMLLSRFPWHFPHHLHALFLSMILLLAVGFGWLLPSLSVRYAGGMRLLALVAVLSLVIVQGASWVVLHLSNSEKGCINFFGMNEPTLDIVTEMADVLAGDRRFREQQYEPLKELHSAYGIGHGKISGLHYALKHAVRRREQRGEQFTDLTGRYIVMLRESLPFNRVEASAVREIGPYVLVRQEPLVQLSSLVIAKTGDARDLGSAREAADDVAEPFRLGEPWFPAGASGCFARCPLVDFEGPGCDLCLGTSTVYLRAVVSPNRTARTALVVSEPLATDSYMVGAVYLNDEPLYSDGELLVPGESPRPQEVMMDVTGRLDEDPNVVEVLLFSRPGSRGGRHVRPDIFLLSGE